MMSNIGWINNASSVPLNANTGTVPSMEDAMYDWFQPMIFGVITKTVSDFQVIESVVDTNFMGVWQPLSGRQLVMKSEGQRQWSWWMLHSDLKIDLKIDDIVIYLTKQYRVMSKKNYSLYRYQYYELVEDWLSSGPPTP